MGGGSFSSADWDHYSSSIASMGADSIYTAPAAKTEFVPSAIKVREAFDTPEHPLSTPLILALDVTGSMDSVLEATAKNIGQLMLDIMSRKTVSDPQIASMAIGDVICDPRSKPALQFTQFESDNRCVEQLTSLHFSRGGGNNDNESYSLAWLAAAYLTDCHALTKRGKKGYLFTIGDEQPTEKLQLSYIRQIFPDADLVPCPEGGIDSETALIAAEKKWHCFHIIVAEGNYAREHEDVVLKAWVNLMGQRAIVLDDVNNIAQVITSIIEVNEGRSVDDVAGSWDGSTAVSVRKAVSSIVPSGSRADTGLVIVE